MGKRGLTILLFVYLALDFANPLMPGAVQFAGGFVEVVQADRARPEMIHVAADLAPASAPLPRPPAQVGPARRSTPDGSVPRNPVAPRVWRAPHASSDPPPALEDH
jgi:hypothetical protein